jgi:hypothetical protein
VGKQNRFDLECRTPETGFSRAPLVNEGPGPKRERDFSTSANIQKPLAEMQGGRKRQGDAVTPRRGEIKKETLDENRF